MYKGKYVSQYCALNKTDVRFVSPRKASTYILVTESGIVIEVKPSKSAHKYIGILFTLLPKVKDVMLLHP